MTEFHSQIDDKINELVERAKNKPAPTISFEFFPAKSEEANNQLWQAIKDLELLKPSYVSVTYGAGGTTREGTYNIVKSIKEQTSLEPAAHLTCIGSTKEEIHDIVQEYLELGINKIVALRGDPPPGKSFTPTPGGYAYASDLVQGLMEIDDFDISVAAYPETHPEAESADSDLSFLKLKLEAGAKRAITQYCFDTDIMLSFVDKARAIGINAPIIPGIVIIQNIDQIVRFSERCGASVPDWLKALFVGTENNPELAQKISTYIALEQSIKLIEAGIDEFHYYTLNHASIVKDVCQALGIAEYA